MGLIAAAIPVLILLTVISVQKSRLNKDLTAQLDKEVKTNLSQIALDTYSLCQSQQESLQQTVGANLNVAQKILRDSGGASLRSGTNAWDAQNQFTKESTRVNLPQFNIGGRSLNRVRDFETRVPVVDEVNRLVGGTCTIFQRMNEQGDMLRVATNVRLKDGTRAIGTYIPAVKPDGSANPVIDSVIKGERFTGRAQVVGEWYIASYEPIKDKSGRIIGMLYVGVKQENVTSLRAAIQNAKIGKTGYVFVLGGSEEQRGKYVISSGGKRDGENIWDVRDDSGKYFVREIINGSIKADGKPFHISYTWKNPGENKARTKLAACVYFKEWDWVIGAGAYEDEFAAARNSAKRSMGWLLFSSLLAGFIGLGASFLLAAKLGIRMITPINKAVEVLKDIAEGEGDLTQRLDVNGKDEIAELSKWFNVFVDKIHEIVAKAKYSADTVAASSKQLSATTAEVGSSTQQITETISQVAEGSQEQSTMIQSGASSMEQLSRAIQEVASGAQNQAKLVDETVGLVQQISQAIDVVNMLSEQASGTGRQVAQVAGEGGLQVAQAVDGMTRIKDATDTVAEMVQHLGNSSDQIGMIIETINDIAEQTNLLALNAAIEAARAGEHGKGFAVVADEVRKLAERSSKATGEIADLINSIQSTTRNAVSAMQTGSEQVAEGTQLAGQAGEALSKIEESVAGIVSQIEQMSVAMEKMNIASSEVVRSIENVSAVTEETTASAEEMMAASSEVVNQIEQVAAVSQENAASTQQVSAAAQEQNASIEELTAAGEELSRMARELQKLVGGFKLDDSDKGESSVGNEARRDSFRKAA